MGKYMNADLFLKRMGLSGKEQKYGNRDEREQADSYATRLCYEIVDAVEDSLVDPVHAAGACYCMECAFCKRGICTISRQGNRLVRKLDFCSRGRTEALS